MEKCNKCGAYFSPRILPIHLTICKADVKEEKPATKPTEPVKQIEVEKKRGRK